MELVISKSASELLKFANASTSEDLRRARSLLADESTSPDLREIRGLLNRDLSTADFQRVRELLVVGPVPDDLQLVREIGTAQVPADLRKTQELVRSCLDEVICYGNSEAEDGAPPQGAEDPFASVVERLRKEKFQINVMAQAPPVFLAYQLEPRTREGKKLALLVEAMNQVPPSYWARCEHCHQFWVKRRLRKDTRFCRELCRHAFHNSAPGRREQKRELAVRKRKEGSPSYFR